MKGYTEQQIEGMILNYLNSLGGFCMKINMSGRPFMTPKGIKMIPFKSKYWRRGMSDILFLRFGRLYAFEVKTVKEHSYIKNNLDKIQTTNYYKLNDKQKHILRQYDFLKEIRDNGGVSGFVSSIDDIRGFLNEDD